MQEDNYNSDQTHFRYCEDYDGVCYIETAFFVYRERFGHHPSWLPQDEERGKREGFPTQFYFLLDDNLTREKAISKVKEYRRQYDALITEIENDDRKWDEYPWQNRPITFSK